MENERYNLERAQGEEARIQQKIKSGAASSYPEAEKLVEDENNPEIFLYFRKEKAKELNDEICGPYYSGTLTAEDIQKRLFLSEEETQTVQFMLDSFKSPRSPDKLKRKDGSFIAVHSLQLFITARDFCHVASPQILDTLLLHDVVEDTTVTLSDIAQKLGEDKAKLASIMTEQRNSGEATMQSRIQEVIDFTKQICSGGYAAGTAEVLDRMDDIADLAYLLNPLRKNPEDALLKAKAKEKLVAKFTKCLYTVKRVAKVVGGQNQEIVADFNKLLEYQCAEMKSLYNIDIAQGDIEAEMKSYLELENKQRKFNRGGDKEMAKDWKIAAQRLFDTEHNRLESTPEKPVDPKLDITRLHGESFIEQTIPRLIAAKGGRGKVKILDVGGGLGLYTDQIRQTFGDHVKVYSTGLNKETANRLRRGVEGMEKLHPNDLKWSSILQLSNYPEFDLIIDTYGEQAYFTKQIDGDWHLALDTYEKMAKFFKYLEAVVAKLNSGGHASIVSVIDNDPYSFNEYLSYFKLDMEKKYHCQLSFQWDEKTRVFKVDKLSPK